MNPNRGEYSYHKGAGRARGSRWLHWAKLPLKADQGRREVAEGCQKYGEISPCFLQALTIALRGAPEQFSGIG
jgi:hypothetical protein